MKKSSPPAPKTPAQAARQERLAQALRDNLRKRKSQTRARDAGPATKAEPPKA